MTNDLDSSKKIGSIAIMIMLMKMMVIIVLIVIFNKLLIMLKILMRYPYSH